MTLDAFKATLDEIGREHVHIRTVSGDLFTGDFIRTGGHYCLVECAMSGLTGTYKVAIAVEYIESISQSY